MKPNILYKESILNEIPMMVNRCFYIENICNELQYCKNIRYKIASGKLFLVYINAVLTKNTRNLILKKSLVQVLPILIEYHQFCCNIGILLLIHTII